MTLMPVGKTWALGSRVSNAGGSRWISQWSTCAFSSSGESRGSPITLNT